MNLERSIPGGLTCTAKKNKYGQFLYGYRGTCPEGQKGAREWADKNGVTYAGGGE